MFKIIEEVFYRNIFKKNYAIKLTLNSVHTIKPACKMAFRQISRVMAFRKKAILLSVSGKEEVNVLQAHTGEREVVYITGNKTKNRIQIS